MNDAEHERLIANVRTTLGDEIADEYAELCKKIKGAAETKDFGTLKKCVLDSEALLKKAAQVRRQQK